MENAFLSGQGNLAQIHDSENKTGSFFELSFILSWCFCNHWALMMFVNLILVLPVLSLSDFTIHFLISYPFEEKFKTLVMVKPSNFIVTGSSSEKRRDLQLCKKWTLQGKFLFLIVKKIFVFTVLSCRMRI